MLDRKMQEVAERVRKLEEESEKDQNERELIRMKVRELNKKMQELAKVIRN